MLSRYLQQHIQSARGNSVCQISKNVLLNRFEKLVTHGLRIPPFNKKALMGYTQFLMNERDETLARCARYDTTLQTRMYMLSIALNTRINLATLEVIIQGWVGIHIVHSIRHLNKCCQTN